VRFLLSAAGSESQAETLFSDGFTTTTTISESASEQAYGTPVTFTATVTNTSSGAPPTGTVTFQDTFLDASLTFQFQATLSGAVTYSSSGNTLRHGLRPAV